MKRASYVPGAVPRTLGPQILDWLRREFYSIRDALNQIAVDIAALSTGGTGTITIDKAYLQALATTAGSSQTISSSTWSPITVLDTVIVNSPLIAFNTTTDQFTIAERCRLKWSGFLDFSFSSQTGARALRIRLRDLAGPTIFEFDVAVHTSTTTLTMAFEFIVDLPPGSYPASYQVEIQGSASFSSFIQLAGNMQRLEGMEPIV